MDLTITDVRIAIHDGFCGCNEPFNPRTGEWCTDSAQEALERSMIQTLLERGVLVEVTVNDDAGCKHLLSGCCWICGAVGDHGGQPHDEATGDKHTRFDIVELMDGRRWRHDNDDVL